MFTSSFLEAVFQSTSGTDMGKKPGREHHYEYMYI